MKMIDLLYKVDTTEPSRVDFQSLCEELGISACKPDDFDERVKAYHPIKWLCTDTWVGLQVIYWDDSPIATTWQNARHNNKEWRFMSRESAERLRKYALTKQEELEWKLIDSHEELGETYTVSYGSQLLVKEGFYNGQPVTVVKTFDGCENVKRWGHMLVQEAHGIKFIIPVKEFKILIPLKKVE